MEYTEDGIQEECMTDDELTNYYYIIGWSNDWLAPWVVAINEEYYFDIEDIWCAIHHNMDMNIVRKWYLAKEDDYTVTEWKWGFPNLYHYWRQETIPKSVLDEERKQEIQKTWENLKKTTICLYKQLWLTEEGALESIKDLNPDNKWQSKK